MSAEIAVKLLMIGDSGVGKSCLLVRFSQDNKKAKVESHMPTIGIDFKIKRVVLDGNKVKLQIWDTAGQERFRTMTTSYYRGSQGILLVYDITDKKSFTAIRSWIAQIKQHSDANVNMILVGNKCDRQDDRCVSTKEGESLAREFKIKFFETSAVQDLAVDDCFMSIAADVVNRINGGGGSSGGGGGGNENSGIVLQAEDDSGPKSDRKRCC